MDGTLWNVEHGTRKGGRGEKKAGTPFHKRPPRLVSSFFFARFEREKEGNGNVRSESRNQLLSAFLCRLFFFSLLFLFREAFSDVYMHSCTVLNHCYQFLCGSTFFSFSDPNSRGTYGLFALCGKKQELKRIFCWGKTKQSSRLSLRRPVRLFERGGKMSERDHFA